MQKGLFVKSNADNLINSKQQLSKVIQLNNVLDIYQIKNTLLVGHTGGIWFYNTQNKVSKKISNTSTTRKITPTLNRTNTILASTVKGLMKLSKESQQWQAVPIKNSPKSIPYLAEYQPGQFLTSDDNGVLSKTILNTTLDSVIHHKIYGTRQGLPQKNGNRVFQIKDEIVIATYQGIYRYDAPKNKFEPHPYFANIRHLFVRYVKGDKKGNLWLWAGKPGNLELLFLKKGIDNSYQIIRTPFQKLKKTFMEFGTHIHPIDEHNVLFGAPEGAVHYDPGIKINHHQAYPCLIRKVETLRDGKKDSLIFGGNFVDHLGYVTAQQPTQQPTQQHIKLPYTLNNLRFSFAATWYENNEQLQYSTYLKGFEHSWSSWTGNVQKEYTNLPEGKYVFYVKARNIYGKESLQASYTFTIHPPWQRTIWAYTGFIITGMLFIWGLLKVNTRRLRTQKLKLENIVESRTTEISQQKEEISAQATELKAMNEQIVELSNFKEHTTNMIVHDLKNPLSGIIGMASSDGENKLEKAKMLSVAQRMLYMVQDILDVQKSEKAEVDFELSHVDIATVTEEAISQQRILADAKSIHFFYDFRLGNVVKADPQILLRILSNLISNAIKFTPNNGKIHMLLEYIQNDTMLKIAIQDTGIGIPATQLDKVFDKFYAASKGSSGAFRSTGLGLTFCKMAVEQQGGNIGVESKTGEGSTFWFTLPLVSKTNYEITQGVTPPKNLILEEVQKIKNNLHEQDLALVKAIVQQIRKQKVNHTYPTRLARIFYQARQKVDISPPVEQWMQMLQKEASNETIFEALLNF